jgi:flagellar hook-associated protein 2
MTITDDGNLTAFTTATLTHKQTAQDAKILIDGSTTASSASNVFTGAIDGLTITASAADAPGTSQAVTVTRDTSGAAAAVHAFVRAYNDLSKLAADLSKYDGGSKQAGTLLGDSAVQSMQNQLRDVLTSGVTGTSAAYTLLSQVGVMFQKDGTLAVDGAKLQSVLDNPNGNVAALFVEANGMKGVAAKMDDAIDGLIGTGGVLASRTDGINAGIKAIDKQRDVLNERLDQIQQRYLAQFTALDSLIASMNQTSTFLTQQLANLPGTNSK